MAKKRKKKRSSMPKLSLLDRCIYWFILMVLCALWIMIFAMPVLTFDSIAFADESVIASSQRATLLWVLVPWMGFFSTAFILWAIPYQEKRPLFGIRGYQYGPPRTPKIYPLFRKGNPPVRVTENQKRNRTMAALIILGILLVSFIPYPWAFFGRYSLHYDGSITKHNVFNVETQNYSSRDIKSVDFRVYQYRTGRRYSRRQHWSVEVQMVADSGEEYSFSVNEFYGSNGEMTSGLTQMMALKRRFDPSVIRYSGTEDLAKVVQDQGLNEEEKNLLYQLFGITP